MTIFVGFLALLILAPIWILIAALILQILWLVIAGSWLGVIELFFGRKGD